MAPADAVVLLDRSEGLRASEHPAEVIQRRLMAVAPHVRVVFVAEDATPDARAGATQRGVKIVDPQQDLGPELGWAAEGFPSSLAAPRSWTEDDWIAWIRRSYGLHDRQELEPALAVLAGDGERALHAQDLLDLGVATSRQAALRLLRETAKALAGEEFRSPRLVADEAHRVLRELARARPLRWRPIEHPSFERAAVALGREPSLAQAAGLGAAERDDLVALHRLIADERVRKPLSVGAPIAGRGRYERRWAAARRAVELGATTDVDAAADELLARAHDAAEALLAAQYDAVVDPVARFAAAARTAIRLLPPPRWPTGLEVGDGGEPAWCGERLVDLLVAAPDRSTLAELSAATAAIDRALARL